MNHKNELNDDELNQTNAGFSNTIEKLDIGNVKYDIDCPFKPNLKGLEPTVGTASTSKESDLKANPTGLKQSEISNSNIELKL